MNREKSNLIGWRQTLTTSPPNHIRFLLVRATKIAKWKTGLTMVCWLSIGRVPVPDERYDWLCEHHKPVR